MEEMAKYNWRPGVSISAYAEFHGLKLSNPTDADNGLLEPPDYLFESPDRGKAIFSAPHGLEFSCPSKDQADTIFGLDVDLDVVDQAGLYKLVPYNGQRIDPARQLVMVAIANALKRGVTRS
jgi:hypothetical protein